MKAGTRRLLPTWGYWVVMAACASFDVLVGAEIDLWVLFMLPIGFAAWNLGRCPGYMLVALTGAWLVVASLEFGPPYSALRFLLLAVVFKLIAYTVVVFLLGLLRNRQVERLHISSQVAK